jgi:hypothetical protein
MHDKISFYIFDSFFLLLIFCGGVVDQIELLSIVDG